jgi:hypothetical protein
MFTSSFMALQYLKHALLQKSDNGVTAPHNIHQPPGTRWDVHYFCTCKLQKLQNVNLDFLALS